MVAKLMCSKTVGVDRDLVFHLFVTGSEAWDREPKWLLAGWQHFSTCTAFAAQARLMSPLRCRGQRLFNFKVWAPQDTAQREELHAQCRNGRGTYYKSAPWTLCGAISARKGGQRRTTHSHAMSAFHVGVSQHS